MHKSWHTHILIRMHSFHSESLLFRIHSNIGINEGKKTNKHNRTEKIDQRVRKYKCWNLIATF